MVTKIIIMVLTFKIHFFKLNIQLYVNRLCHTLGKLFRGLPTYQFLIPWWLVGHKRHSLGSWTGWWEVLAMNSDHHSINKNIKICTEPKDEKIDPSACYCKTTSMLHFGLGTKLSSTYFIGSYKLYIYRVYVIYQTGFWSILRKWCLKSWLYRPRPKAKVRAVKAERNGSQLSGSPYFENLTI